MRNVSKKRCRENQNTRFMLNKFFSESHAVYGIMCKKYCTAGQATEDNLIRRMRFACQITKATDTPGMCNTYCFSTATMVARTRLNVAVHVPCLSCFSCINIIPHNTAQLFANAPRDRQLQCCCPPSNGRTSTKNGH
jgi:hypothetical protein